MPHLRIEVAEGYRLRIVQGDHTVLWAQAWEDFYGVDIEFAHAVESPIPPLTAVLARRIGYSGTDAWIERWAYLFCQHLIAAKGPLHSGDWVLRPESTPRSHQRPACEGDPPRADWFDDFTGVGRAEIDWDIGMSHPVVPLRPMPRRADGRVKSYVKLLRDGSMPPVLLWWIGGLCSWVVLDGHCRLAAGLVSDTEVPLLALCPVLDESRARERLFRGNDPHAQVEMIVETVPENTAAHNAAARASFLAHVAIETVVVSRAWTSGAAISDWPPFGAAT